MLKNCTEQRYFKRCTDQLSLQSHVVVNDNNDKVNNLKSEYTCTQSLTTLNISLYIFSFPIPIYIFTNGLPYCDESNTNETCSL